MCYNFCRLGRWNILTIAINERIKEIRLALNLTMEQFGQHIGLKKSAISLMESGKNKPSTQTIYSICREDRVLKIQVHILLEGN